MISRDDFNQLPTKSAKKHAKSAFRLKTFNGGHIHFNRDKRLEKYEMACTGYHTVSVSNPPNFTVALGRQVNMLNEKTMMAEIFMWIPPEEFTSNMSFEDTMTMVRNVDEKPPIEIYGIPANMMSQGRLPWSSFQEKFMGPNQFK